MEVRVVIDTGLRFLFFGIEAAMAVSLDAGEMERVFADSEADQVSPKQYRFFRAGRTVVSGSVEEHEPETLVLRVTGNRRLERDLPELVDKAGHHARRLRLGDERDS